MDKQFIKDVFQAHFFFGSERRQKAPKRPERQVVHYFALVDFWSFFPHLKLIHIFKVMSKILQRI